MKPTPTSSATTLATRSAGRSGPAKRALPRPGPLALAVAGAVAVMGVCVSGETGAADRTLVNGSFTWINPATWSPLGEPRHGENVSIPTGSITYAPSTLLAGDTFASLVIGSSGETPVPCGFPVGGFFGRDCFGIRLGNATEPVRVDYPGLSFAATVEMAESPALTLRTDQLVVGGPGESGSGALVLRGGRVQVTGDARLGTALNQAGYVLLAAGAGAPEFSVGGNLILGYRGEGLLIQEAGTTSVGGSLIVGDELMISGVRLRGGDLAVSGDAIIGHNPGGPRNGGFGAFHHEGGSFTVGGNLVVGRSSIAAGNTIGGYRIGDGASLAVGGNIVLGSDTDLVGWGVLQFGGGTVSTAGDLVVKNGWDGRSGPTPGSNEKPNTLFVEGATRLSVGRDLVIGDPGDAVVVAEAFLRDAAVTTVGRDLVLGREAPGNGVLTFESGSLAVARDTLIGSGGTGRLSMTGPGSFSTTGNLVLGSAFGSRGTLELTGSDPASSFSVAGVAVVGDAGAGTFDQRRNGPTSFAGGMIVGNSPGGSGTVRILDAGNLAIGGGLVVGAAGNGGVIQDTSGAFNVTGLTVIGQHAGGAGTVSLIAGSGGFDGGLIIGDSGTGTLNQNRSGSLVVSGSVILGRETGGQGTWNMSHGTGALVAGSLIVGDAGRGTYNGQAAVSFGDIVFGARAGGVGTGSVGLLTRVDWGTQQDLIVGDLGSGNFTAQLAHVQTGRDMIVGRGAGGVGVLAVTPASRLTAGRDLIVGDDGTGTMTMQRAPGGGSVADVAVGGNLVVGLQAGGSGTVTHDLLGGSPATAGGLIIDGAMRIGVSGDGRVVLGTGAHATGLGISLAENVGSRGELHLAGTGSLTIHNQLALNGFGDARVVQDGFDVSIVPLPNFGTADLIMGASTGTRRYDLRSGRLDVGGAVTVVIGSFAALGGTLSAAAMSIGRDGIVDLDRELSLGGVPGTGHHVGIRLNLSMDGRLAVPTLSIHEGGEYTGSPAGDLQTNSILMDGGRVFGVLQNDNRFTYHGGSFANGAELWNDGFTDLRASLSVGGLDNRGIFEVPAPLSLTVGQTGQFPGTGRLRVLDYGRLNNAGIVTTRSLDVLDDGLYRQTAGLTRIEAGVTIDTPGVRSPEVDIAGGRAEVSAGNVTVGAAGAGVLRVTSARLDVPAGRIDVGPRGLLHVDGGSLAGSASNPLQIDVASGGRFVTSGMDLSDVADIAVAGTLVWAGGQVNTLAGGGGTIIEPGGSFLVEIADPDVEYLFRRPLDNQGTWRMRGPAYAGMNSFVTHSGTLDVAEGLLALRSGVVSTGSVRVAMYFGTLSLGGDANQWLDPGNRQYEFSGRFDNDGRVELSPLRPIEAVFRSTGQHGGVFEPGAGTTLSFADGVQNFGGPGNGIVSPGIVGTGTVAFRGGSTRFDAGSAYAATGPLLLHGGSLRFTAGSSILLPQAFAIEGTDLELSTGAPHTYGRDIALSAGAFGGADAFTQTAGRFAWTGGTLYGPGELALDVPVTLAIDGAGDKRLDRHLAVAGNAVWRGGNVAGGGVLELGTGSSFLGTASGDFAPRIETRGSFVSQLAAGTARYLGRFDAIGAAVAVDGGNMKLGGGGSSDSPIEVAPGASIEFAGGDFVFDGAAARLAGGGSAQFTGGRTTFRNGASFGALASEHIAGGILELGAGSHYRFNPALTIESGALIVGTGLGDFTLPAETALHAGALSGSDLRVLGPGGTLRWFGGTIGGPAATRIETGGTMRIAGADAKSLESDLTSAGLVLWEAGSVGGLATFTNHPDGRFEVGAAGNFGPAVDNAGLMRVANGTATAAITGSFRNLGNLRVESGTLQLAGGLMNLAGGTLTGGTWFVAGTLRHSGANIGAVDADVTLAGAGASFRSAANIDLLDSFASVAAGGRLAIESGKNFSLINGRSLSVAGRFEVGDGSVLAATNGSIGGAGVLQVKPGGRMTWSLANLTGAGSTLQVDAGATLVIENLNSNHEHFGRTLVSEGTVQWTNGDLRGGSGGAIANAGLWLDEGGPGTRSINNFAQPAVVTFTNSGTYRKTGTGNTQLNGFRMENSGRIELQGGSVEFLSGGLNTGVIDIAAGRTLTLRGTNAFVFADGSRATGSGALRFEGSNSATLATIEGAASFSNLLMVSGRVDGTHTLDGRVTWQQSLLAPGGTTTVAPTGLLVIEDAASNHEHFGRTLVNQGTVQWTNGDLRGGSGGAIANAGLWRDEGGTGTRSINNFAQPITVTFTNSGTYRKTGSGNTQFNGFRPDNSGRIEIQGGSMEFLSGGRNTGVIDIAAGRTLTLRGTNVFEFADGSRTTGDGVLRFEGSNSATLATIAGAVNFANLVMASGRVGGTHTLDGRVTWQQSLLAPGGTTTVAPTGLLMIADATSNHEHFGRTLVNQGTVRWTTGDLRGGDGSAIVNAGLWEDQATASHNAWNNGVGAVPVFGNTGRYVKTGAGTTNFTGHRLDNTGTVDVQQGTLNLAAGVAQVVGSRLTGGTWIAGTDALILIPGISPLTVNEGSVHLRGPNSRMSGISTLADNRGEFRISEGRNFTTVGNLVNSGLLFAGAGSRLTVNGTLTSTGTLAGGGELQIGLLSAAGPIAPGSSPGVLTVAGNLQMQPTARLDIEIAGLAIGAEYDSLAVTGAAQLAGELRVDLLATFAGLSGARFAILTAGSVSGEFAGLPDGARLAAGGVGGSFVVDYTPTAVYVAEYTAPVPEPETWAMMGAGLALLLARVRRRAGSDRKACAAT